MKVLSQIRPALTDMVAAAAPDAQVIAIPRAGDLPPGVAGEVLLTYPWAFPNLAQVLARGVRWVHVLGTGIDAFPLHTLTDQVLTCSRGASAVPIAEWVLAVMLAFEKRLPEAWIRSAPDGWSRGERGTLEGKTLGLIGFGGIGTAVVSLGLLALAGPGASPANGRRQLGTYLILALLLIPIATYGAGAAPVWLLIWFLLFLILLNVVAARLRAHRA